MRKRAGTVAGIAVMTMLFAGCATGAGTEPTEVPDPTPTESADEYAPAAAWLDEGRAVAVVTWGSSTCPPVVDGVSGDGQAIAVTLAAGASDQACTKDMVPRASLAMLPEGTAPGEDLALTVSGDGVDAEIVLAGDASLTGVPGETTEFRTSAGWFGESGIVLLTWGSSSCTPVVDTVESTGDGVTVAFQELDPERVCTMDIAPRLTVLGVDERPAGDVTLTLVGDNLDATVPIVG